MNDKLEFKTSDKNVFRMWIPEISDKMFDHFTVTKVQVTVVRGDCQREVEYTYIAP